MRHLFFSVLGRNAVIMLDAVMNDYMSLGISFIFNKRIIGVTLKFSDNWQERHKERETYSLFKFFVDESFD